jgi:hypothetical protein
LKDDDIILYQIDTKKPFSQIHEEIKALHMQAHAIMPGERAKLSQQLNIRYLRMCLLTPCTVF